ncbi:MAG: CehA/McbA family metallohydrolase [Vicinamibacterales bacterium]
MKRAIVTTAALVAAVVVLGLSLPPEQVVLTDAWDDRTVRGTLHVHSLFSDGRGSIDEIAAAAARAGLAFVVLTDHGDGTRRPEPPSYRSGVLCIDAVEISTRNGHYVALGIGQAPYRLGGEARDVADDVRRLGGFGIAAHPDSPRAELSWSDWTATIDGIELINADTAWRVQAVAAGWKGRALLLGSLFTYPVRPAESIARLLTTSTEVRQHWTDMNASRQVVGLAGVDAHAKVPILDAEPGDNRFSIPIPSYESSFQTLSVHVVPARPFGGEASADAASLLDGIRRGRAYVSIDGWASPAAFELHATNGTRTVQYGESLEAEGPVTLRGRSNAPDGYQATVWRGSSLVAEGLPGREFELAVGEAPGIYWVEVGRPSAAGPAWITSNPIYVGVRSGNGARDERADSIADRVAPLGDGVALFDGRTARGWSIEHDPTSLASVDVAPTIDSTGGAARVRLRYGLAGGDTAGQYAAATAEIPFGAAAQAGGAAFSIRGERPMRVSVQVRADEDGVPPQRWSRSIYVDSSERQYRIPFEDMRAVGQTRLPRPIRPALRALMFVVDTTNTKPGASGRLWIGGVRLLPESAQRISGPR